MEVGGATVPPASLSNDAGRPEGLPKATCNSLRRETAEPEAPGD